MANPVGFARGGVDFLILIWRRRSLIWEMAKRDLAQKYVGSLLGLVWTLIQPLTLVTLFWFVFGLGLRSQPVADVPFTVWLTAGLAPWFALAEIVAESATIITANPHLIKKIVFPAQILPVVKIVAAFLSHMIFLAILVGLMLFQGMELSWWNLQFIYYYLCLTVLALGAGWLTSALNVFVRDVAPALGLILQVFFWATPIVWDISVMPANVQFWLKLNPVYYIVHGYRQAFVSHEPFWTDLHAAGWFWLAALALFTIGAAVFKRLKPHFADVI